MHKIRVIRCTKINFFYSIFESLWAVLFVDCFLCSITLDDVPTWKMIVFDQHKIPESRPIVFYRFYASKPHHVDLCITMLAVSSFLVRVLYRFMKFKKDHVTTSHIIPSITTFLHPYTPFTTKTTSLALQHPLSFFSSCAPEPREEVTVGEKCRWKSPISSTFTIMDAHCAVCLSPFLVDVRRQTYGSNTMSKNCKASLLLDDFR